MTGHHRFQNSGQESTHHWSIKEDIDEYFLREEDEEETFDDVSTADILNPNIPAPWETKN